MASSSQTLKLPEGYVIKYPIKSDTVWLFNIAMENPL